MSLEPGFRRPLLLFTKQDLRQAATPTSSVDEKDYSIICQECGSEDKTQCFHPQFTGMRRGPYASYLYDHVNYPSYASSESPLFAATQRANASHSFSNSFGSGGFGGSGFYDYSGDSRDMDYSFAAGRAPHISNEPMDYNGVQRGLQDHAVGSSVHSSSSSSRSGRSAGSQDSSGSSSRSWSSSMSGSGSGSTSSTPSTSTIGSASYYSPEPQGINGEVAVEYDNGACVQMNGVLEDGIEHDLINQDIPSPIRNGGVNQEVQEDFQNLGADVNGAGHGIHVGAFNGGPVQGIGSNGAEDEAVDGVLGENFNNGPAPRVDLNGVGEEAESLDGILGEHGFNNSPLQGADVQEELDAMAEGASFHNGSEVQSPAFEANSINGHLSGDNNSEESSLGLNNINPHVDIPGAENVPVANAQVPAAENRTSPNGSGVDNPS